MGTWSRRGPSIRERGSRVPALAAVIVGVLLVAVSSVTVSFRVSPLADDGSPQVDFTYSAINIVSNIPVGSFDTGSVVIHNSGTAPLSISDASTTGDFVATGPGDCAGPVPPDGYCAVPVEFRPTADGLRQGLLTVTDNTAAGHHSVKIVGTAGDGYFDPQSPTLPLTFPQQPLGTSTTRPVTFTNAGAAPGYVIGIVNNPSEPPDPEFAISNDTCHEMVLDPGASCTVDVTFTPSADGYRRGSITMVEAGGSGAGQGWFLSGIGGTGGPRSALSFAAGSASFPDTFVGDTSNVVVTATNTGDVPVLAAGPQLTGDFRSAPTSPVCSIIRPGQSCSWYLQFDPTSAGLRDGTLTILDSTPQRAHTVTLSGRAVDPGPRPGITSLTPDAGLGRANTPVTLTGTNLSFVTSVEVYGAPIPFTLAPDGSSLAFRMPSTPNTGEATIRIGTATGVGTETAFTYLPAPPPVITSVSPGTVSSVGGTLVRVTGTDLDALGVDVDGVPIPRSAFTVAPNRKSLSFRVPAHPDTASPVDFGVYTASGSAEGRLTAVSPPAPRLTSLTPGNGPAKGGTMVRINGTDLGGASAVTVGGQTVPLTVNPAGTVASFRTPTGSPGSVSVTLGTPSGPSNALTYTFDPIPGPALSALTPTHGPLKGGTAVRVTGTNLAGATLIVDGQPVPATVNNAGTAVSFRTPAHTSGTVSIVVRTTAGSATTSYTYDPVPAPALTTSNPRGGPATGGTNVRITGTDLTGATTVSIDGRTVPATVNAAGTTITFRTPPHAPGRASITVIATGGASNALTYTYS